MRIICVSIHASKHRSYRYREHSSLIRRDFRLIDGKGLGDSHAHTYTRRQTADKHRVPKSNLEVISKPFQAFTIIGLQAKSLSSSRHRHAVIVGARALETAFRCTIYNLYIMYIWALQYNNSMA